jgi:hypothetical protein
MTIAAHTEHLRWSLANLNNTIAGNPWNPNWAESWQVRSLEQSDWTTLQAALKNEYESLRRVIQSSDRWWSDQLHINGMIATVAHAAYHLGAMRVLLKT